MASATVLTDAEGRFELRGLAAGRYLLRATRDGYATVAYGAQTAWSRGRELLLAEGEAAGDIDFALPRAAVITGRVTDQFGDPVIGAVVEAAGWRYLGGARRLLRVAQAETDDTGAYRLYGLPPGTYFVAATPAADPASPTSQHTGEARLWYPGVAAVARASPVPLGTGQELPGIDLLFLSWSTAITADVKGQVVDSAGVPAPMASVTLLSMGAGTGLSMSGSRTDADGMFRFAQVPAGDYLAVAALPVADGRAETVSQSFSTAGSEPIELRLRTEPGARLVGRVQVERCSAPFAPSSVLVRAVPRHVLQVGVGEVQAALTTMIMRVVEAAAVSPDWRFEVEVHGPRSLRLAGLPEPFGVKSVRLGEHDITGLPVDFRPGQTTSGIEVVVSDRLAGVAGRVVDERGHAVADATVVVFAADEEQWIRGESAVQAVVPDRTGAFRVRGLIPGSYLAVASDPLDEGAWNDPELLRVLRPAATSVRVRDGELTPATLLLSTPGSPRDTERDLVPRGDRR